jgi:hypothetical protein
MAEGNLMHIDFDYALMLAVLIGLNFMLTRYAGIAFVRLLTLTLVDAVIWASVLLIGGLVHSSFVFGALLIGFALGVFWQIKPSKWGRIPNIDMMVLARKGNYPAPHVAPSALFLDH